jgi:hypothetical protein
MDAYMIDSPDKEAHMDVALQFGRDFNNTHALVYQTPGHTIYYYADNNSTASMASSSGSRIPRRC